MLLIKAKEKQESSKTKSDLMKKSKKVAIAVKYIIEANDIVLIENKILKVKNITIKENMCNIRKLNTEWERCLKPSP